MSLLRVLVVGHGLIGSERARAVASFEGRSVVAATVDPLERDAELYGAAPHANALEDVDPASFDAAVVAVPHDLTAGLAERVLALRKPVLVEKPLGTSVADAARIGKAAGALSQPSFVGYNYRFLPTIREALARVRLGELGVLRSVDVLMGHGGNPRSAEGWKLRRERAGGGALLDPGVHLLDLVRLFLPNAACVGIAASGGFWKTGIEEDVAAVFAADRATATVRVSLVRWVNTFRVEVVGEDGYAFIEGRGGTYGPQTLRLGQRWAWNDGSGRPQRATEQVFDFGAGNDSLRDEMDAAIAIWRDEARDPGAPAPASMADGLATTELWEGLDRRLQSPAS